MPKITDFGLAQTIEGGQTMTQSGLLVGTPRYMAPEQAGGQRALVGPATDIYALGVILYQLITGQLPFQGRQHSGATAGGDERRAGPARAACNRGCPATWRRSRCTAWRSGRRIATPSALALAEDLRAIPRREASGGAARGVSSRGWPALAGAGP